MTTLKRHVEELLKRKPPLTVVNAVIQKQEEVLLIKRAKEPAKGTWVIPGGHVEANEDLEEAVIREVKEETGLDVKVIDLIESHADKEGIDPRGYHLVVTFLTVPIGGEVGRKIETQDIKWFKLNNLPSDMGLDSKRYFQKTITKEQQISELVKYIPPMPMVNQVIYKDKSVLLGKRNKSPYLNSWGIPGGHFSFVETLEEASLRKVKDETGLSVEVGKVIDIYNDFSIDPRSQNLVITLVCKYISGEPKKGEAFNDFYWHDLEKELPKDIEILNPGFLRAVQKAKDLLIA